MECEEVWYSGVECQKERLIDHSGEKSNAKRHTESTALVLEVSLFFQREVQVRGYAILAMSLASFLLHPDNLSEVKFKDKGLICLVEGGRMRRLKVRTQGIQTTKQLRLSPRLVALKRSLGVTGSERKVPFVKGSN